METVSRYSLEELDNFAKTVDEQTLIKNWGEPKIANNERLWPVDLTGETKYMVAYIEDGKIISIYESEMMFINVVLDNGGIKYCTYGWSDYSSDPYSIAFMPTKDIFGNEITCEVGDQILLETDGRVINISCSDIVILKSAERQLLVTCKFICYSGFSQFTAECPYQFVRRKILCQRQIKHMIHAGDLTYDIYYTWFSSSVRAGTSLSVSSGTVSFSTRLITIVTFAAV
ncbi:MAG: hypothetical protein K5779_07135 [Saccharofermentans sp.]|nr:hypothetical protein [Saccharofermentans sp.]